MISIIVSMARRLVVMVKSYGIVSTVRLIWILISNMMYLEEKDYDFVLLPTEKRGEGKHLPKGPLTLTWFIPDFDVGSGGHTTIFRIISLLQVLGHKSTIVLIPPTKFQNRGKALEVVVRHFVTEFTGEFMFWGEELPESDVVIATSWQTAYYVNSLGGSAGRFYFVQDFEPHFFPMGSLYVFAENTYRLGLKCLAASPWLANLLRENYGAQAASFDLAYSPGQYFPMNITRKPKTVLFYARHLTVRRGFELGILALKLLKRAAPDVEVILFGATAYPNIPFPCTCLGVLSHEELLRLYNMATVGLVISLTNYSLIPNEMMACRLPVVDMETECMSMIYRNGVDIVLAPPDPHRIASAILSLLQDDSFRETIAKNAHQAVTRLTWEKTAQRIDELIRNL